MAVGTWQCDKCKQPLVGNETVCPNCGTTLIPVLSAPPAVEIRRYASVAAYQADAASMANAGWHVVAQSESSGGPNGSMVAIAVVLGAIGLFLLWPLLIVALLVLILGAVNGRKQMVVTYRPGAATVNA